MSAVSYADNGSIQFSYSSADTFSYGQGSQRSIESQLFDSYDLGSDAYGLNEAKAQAHLSSGNVNSGVSGPSVGLGVGGSSEPTKAGEYTPTLGKGESRGLTDGERGLVVDEFGEGTLDLDAIRIHRDKSYFGHPKDRAMAPDGDIYFHPKGNLYRDDFSKEGLNGQGLFIHEMTHVYQVQSTGKSLWLTGALDIK